MAISNLEQEARDQILADLAPLTVGSDPDIYTLKFYQPGAMDQVELASGNMPAVMISASGSGLSRFSDTGDMYNRTFLLTLIVEIINPYDDILYYCDKIIDALKGKYYEMSWEGGVSLVDKDMSFVYRNLIITIPGDQAI